jgi:hypothetical protein
MALFCCFGGIRNTICLLSLLLQVEDEVDRANNDLGTSKVLDDLFGTNIEQS